MSSLWKRAIEELPGTRKWRRATVRNALPAALQKWRFLLQQQLPIVQQSAAARHYALNSLKRVSISKHATTSVRQSLRHILIPPVLIVAVTAPIAWMLIKSINVPSILAARLFPQLLPILAVSLAWLIFVLTQLVLFVVYFLFLFAPVFLESRFASLGLLLMLQLVWAFSIVGSYTYQAITTTRSSSFFLLITTPAAIGVAASFYFLVGASMFGVLATWWLVEHRFVVTRPEAVIMDHLLITIQSLDREQGSWFDLRFRQYVMTNIEATAYTLEMYWWKHLRAGDVEVDEWVRIKCARIATAFRDLKKWLASPKIDSREQLLNRLRHDLNLLIIGDIDALEQREPHRRRLGSQVMGFARAITISFLPLGLLWCFRYLALTIETGLLQWITAGAYLWTVVGLLAALDPMLASKLGMLKDIRALLRPPKDNAPAV
jgi:hypothetical protein